MVSNHPIKLNVGCGRQRKEGYVNIDKYAPGADVQTGADALPYADDEVDEVFTSHLIEHLLPDELDAALREWARVLRQGGRLVLRCPNFDVYVAEYYHATPEQRARNPWLLRHIFGWRNKPGAMHHDGFGIWRLRHLLPQYGFQVQACRAVATRKGAAEARPNGDILCEAVRA